MLAVLVQSTGLCNRGNVSYCASRNILIFLLTHFIFTHTTLDSLWYEMTLNLQLNSFAKFGAN